MAKLKITKALNRFELVKFFREENPKIALSEAVYYVNNLPYEYNDVSDQEAEAMAKNLSAIAEVSVEKDPESCSCSFSPPQEYTDALAWYERLSDEERGYINAIAKWWKRIGIC